MLDQILDTLATAEAADTAACAGIPAGAQVLTMRGAVAVEELQVGERLITRNGTRTLRAVEVELLSDLAVVRIAAGALGHDRPEADLTLPAGQRLFLRDWRAQALYGTREAMVPAARLVDGEFLCAGQATELRLFRLGFDGPEIVYADGVELACAPLAITA